MNGFLQEAGSIFKDVHLEDQDTGCLQKNKSKTKQNTKQKQQQQKTHKQTKTENAFFLYYTVHYYQEYVQFTHRAILFSQLHG